MKLTAEQECLLFGSGMRTDADQGRNRIALLQSLKLDPGPQVMAFAQNYIEHAINGRDADDLERGLSLGFWFDFSQETARLLRGLIGEMWHHSHEDIVWALDHELRDETNVEAFYQATQIVPPYLEFDDARALAVKAIWALGNLGTTSAKKRS